MTEILAIDDDREILAVIKKALLREGYQVTALEDPLQLEEDKLGRYQLILLDVMMPGIDGFDLCRRIREKVDCPILFLTAKTEEKDVMTGLGAGGDDYITKPFGIGELRARVAAHIRRENREKTHTICIGEVRFSMQERKIYVQEHELVFTKAEYTICEFLALNHGQVFSKECILEHVFGFDGDSNSSAITEHVKISVQNSRNSGLTRLKRFGGSAIDGNEKRRQKTLTGLFLKFAALFCLDTFGIGMVCLLLLVLSPMTGFTLPANYAELQLTDHTEEIKAAGTEVEALIPDGCRYGIYDAAGQFKTGTFSADAQKRAWQGYKNGSKYASMGKFYCYIKQSSGDICIVTYDLHMRYVVDKLNGIVPSPEILAPVLGVVLFFLHAILLSGHFAKN